MSTKDDASLDQLSNGQSLVTHQSAPVGTRDIDWGPVSTYAQGQEYSQTNPSVYLHAIRRHWFPALLLGVIFAGISGVTTWFLLPKNYTATSMIEVAMDDPGLVFTQKNKVSLQEYEIFKATQAQLVKSPLVLTAALRKPEVTSTSIYQREKDEDPTTWLQDKLSVFFPGDSQIMQIRLTAKEKEEVVKIVRAVANAYLSEIVETERNIKARELAAVEDVLATKERQIRQRRTALKALAEDLGTVDGDALRMHLQFATQQLGMYRSQLGRLEMDLRMLRAEHEVAQRALRRLDNSPPTSLELERMKLQDQVCRDLQQKISELQMVQAQANGRAVSTRKEGTFERQINEQLRGLQEDLQARLAQLNDVMTEATRSQLKEKAADFAVQVELAVQAEEELRQKVEKQQEQFEKLGQSSVELEMMRSELTNLEEVVRNIAVKRESLDVENKSRPRIRLLQRAEAPKTYDNFQLNAMLSAFIASICLAFPMVVFVWWDIRKQRINSTEDVAKGLGLTVMGSVPLIPGRAIKQLNAPGKRNQHWNVRLAESIDSIAAKLLRNATVDQDRVVLITSAISGEGKTTLATQIAMSLARAGKKTVLVDFDLRRPAVDKAFQLPLYPGVSEALCGENDITSLPQPTGLPNLEVVTAGRCDRHALQALAGGGDMRLFDELKQKYEFVIVDGSPILPVADSRYISQHVDSVVLSVFRDYSRAPKVASAYEILESFGVTDIEAVVTSPGEDGYGTINAVTQEPSASA